jgi:hypothetical protein
MRGPPSPWCPHPRWPGPSISEPRDCARLSRVRAACGCVGRRPACTRELGPVRDRDSHGAGMTSLRHCVAGSLLLVRAPAHGARGSGSSPCAGRRWSHANRTRKGRVGSSRPKAGSAWPCSGTGRRAGAITGAHASTGHGSHDRHRHDVPPLRRPGARASPKSRCSGIPAVSAHAARRMWKGTAGTAGHGLPGSWPETWGCLAMSCITAPESTHGSRSRWTGRRGLHRNSLRADNAEARLLPSHEPMLHRARSNSRVHRSHHRDPLR